MAPLTGGLEGGVAWRDRGSAVLSAANALLTPRGGTSGGIGLGESLGRLNAASSTNLSPRKEADSSSFPMTRLGPPPSGPMPRHVHVRSKIVMQRGSNGAYSTLPPQDLLAAGSFCESTFNSSCGGSLMQTTHYAGDQLIKVPIELVSASSGSSGSHTLQRRPIIRGKVMADVWGTDDPSSPGGRGKIRNHNDPPPLTPELHTDLKNRMNNLAAVCRVHEFQRNPFKLRHFVRELHDICETLEVPLAQKTYRKGYGYKMLHSFLRLVPEAIGSEVLSYSGELPLTGFLTFTILITLCEIQWVFAYNSLTHKICNCSTIFPGIQRCLAPVVGKASDAMESGLADSLAASLAAGLAGIPTGPQSLTDRIEALQQHERHFPTKLMELSQTVRKRILIFCLQVPTFMSDLNSMPMQGPEKLQRWASFVSSFSAEVSALDLYYMHFEQLYLALIDKMIGTALEPVRGMSGPSSSLVNTWGDPFRPVQTAVLCQRLGLLKQQVSFGGPHNLVHFDSQLLAKATRILQIHTFEEVRRMALSMLTNFNSLCSVLDNLHDDQLQPELRENEELRDTVVRLEAIWAECQFVLQQGVLDFMQQLLDYLPQASATCRWQLRLAMEVEDLPTLAEVEPDKPDIHHHFSEEHREAMERREQVEREIQTIQEARKMFFETLPILMYLDEMRRDIKQSEAGGGDISTHYRDLFCPKNDRHHMLRRDFAKFDERRYTSFRNFLLGIQEEEVEGSVMHATYMQNFENMYKQLREVAAFPADISPMKALQAATCLDAAELAETHVSEDRARQQVAVKMAAEARARWVCVQRVVQMVQPELFPLQKPELARRKASILLGHLGSDASPDEVRQQWVEGASPKSPSSNRTTPAGRKSRYSSSPKRMGSKQSILALSEGRSASKEIRHSPREPRSPSKDLRLDAEERHGLSKDDDRAEPSRDDQRRGTSKDDPRRGSAKFASTQSKESRSSSKTRPESKDRRASNNGRRKSIDRRSSNEESSHDDGRSSTHSRSEKKTWPPSPSYYRDRRESQECGSRSKGSKKSFSSSLSERSKSGNHLQSPSKEQGSSRDLRASSSRGTIDGRSSTREFSRGTDARAATQEFSRSPTKEGHSRSPTKDTDHKRSSKVTISDTAQKDEQAA